MLFNLYFGKVEINMKPHTLTKLALSDLNQIIYDKMELNDQCRKQPFLSFEGERDISLCIVSEWQFNIPIDKPSRNTIQTTIQCFIMLLI